MPTYQYACTECGQQLEAVQSFTDPALTECPACQGRLRKVFNSVGIVFKGSGFYRTDSRDNAGKDRADAAAGKGDKAATADSSTGGANGGSTGTTNKDAGAAGNGSGAAATKTAATKTAATTAGAGGSTGSTS